MAAEYSYDGGFDPPAPIIPVRFSFPNRAVREEVPSFVDSGADMTALPFGVIERLRLRQAGGTRVGGFGAATARVPTFWVRLVFQDRPVAALEVLGWDGPYAILGRDLLNRWRVLLDGPAQTVTIEAT